jgi:hypothetical protein
MKEPGVNFHPDEAVQKSPIENHARRSRSVAEVKSLIVYR